MSWALNDCGWTMLKCRMGIIKLHIWAFLKKALYSILLLRTNISLIVHEIQKRLISSLNLLIFYLNIKTDNQSWVNTWCQKTQQTDIHTILNPRYYLKMFMYITDLRDILIKFFNNRAWLSRFNVIFYRKDYKTKIIIQIASDIMV